jgi:hypothetical protein
VDVVEVDAVVQSLLSCPDLHMLGPQFGSFVCHIGTQYYCPDSGVLHLGFKNHTSPMRSTRKSVAYTKLEDVR